MFIISCYYLRDISNTSCLGFRALIYLTLTLIRNPNIINYTSCINVN
jgi:hypothetical protein